MLKEPSRSVSPDATGWGLFSPFSAWFLGSATIFQPYISWPQPLTEPDLRDYRIRLFKQAHIVAA